MDTPQKNIALLIDADNTSPAGIDPVLTVMAELGQVNIRRAYGNFAKGNLSKWGEITNRFGILPQQQFDVAKGKNATDMAMTIDAMDLLQRGKADGFGIMSSDSDFTPLVIRIRQDGLPVYGFGSKNKTPSPFQAACTRFIDLDALIADSQDSSGSPKQSEREQPQDVDTELAALLGAAWKAAKRDDDGFAAVSEIGQIAGNRSSFDIRSYGFNRLSQVFEQLPQFTLRSGENGRLYAKRLR